MFYRHLWIRLQEYVYLYETKIFICIPSLNQPSVPVFRILLAEFQKHDTNSSFSVGLNEIQKIDKWQL